MKTISIFFTFLGFSMLPFLGYSQANILDKLNYKPEKAKVIIDTDAYNEIDDQFALVYALLARDKMDIEAIYAAPFINKRAKSVEEGMEKSYDEILNVLQKMKTKAPVYKGSPVFLKDKKTPVTSDAARDLVERARKATEPVFVLALGAPTNVASALIMAPEIKEKIIVVWLGGKGINWNTANEFNLKQDMHASQILFDCGVPLVQIPTEPVSSHLSTTVPELKEHLGGANKISDYLISIVADFNPDLFGWSKVIWDVAVIAYITDPSSMQYEIRPAPILTDQMTYSFDGTRHLYKVATHINRNKVFKDMFRRFKDFKD